MVFAADAHLAGQLLYEETAVNKGKCLKISNRNARANNFKQGRTKSKTIINVNKKKHI
jgi:hypothetical protein